MPKKKAYELDQVLEMLGPLHERMDDIAKRLEVIYGLGPALEEREVGELGEIIESVSDVIDDFHYSLASYMEGTGIEFEKEEPDELTEPEELSGIEKFIEEKFEWEDEEEEEEEEEELDPVRLEEEEMEYENFYKDLLE
jgi:hypothetical protein